jgi:hypothetical protein
MLGAHEAAGNNVTDAAGAHAHHGAPAIPPIRLALPYFSGDPAFVDRANGVLAKVTNNKFTNITQLKYVVLCIDLCAAPLCLSAACLCWREIELFLQVEAHQHCATSAADFQRPSDEHLCA